MPYSKLLPLKKALKAKKPIRKPTKKKRSPGKLKDDCWALYSRWIRKKYSDNNGLCQCYTCGKLDLWPNLQAGHGVSGRGNYVLFLDEIVRPQCAGCNIFKNGNYQVFVPNLIQEIGFTRYQEIVAQSHLPHKFPKGYLEDLKIKLTNLLKGDT